MAIYVFPYIFFLMYAQHIQQLNTIMIIIYVYYFIFYNFAAIAVAILYAAAIITMRTS